MLQTEMCLLTVNYNSKTLILQVTDITLKYYTCLTKPDRDKYSSLFFLAISDGEKQFDQIVTWLALWTKMASISGYKQT